MQLERDRRPNIVVLVVWSAVIVGGWMVVAFDRKSYLGPAEISSFCTWYNSSSSLYTWYNSRIEDAGLL